MNIWSHANGGHLDLFGFAPCCSGFVLESDGNEGFSKHHSSWGCPLLLKLMSNYLAIRLKVSDVSVNSKKGDGDQAPSLSELQLFAS